MKLAKTYGYLKKDLDSIEESLGLKIQAEHPILKRASLQLLKAGGKRIRPIFVLLAGQLGDAGNRKQLIDAAVSIELIHMATLVHDDVIDNASLRRGKPTIRVQHDNRTAMYIGDYILACALESITNIENPNVQQVLSKTIVEVCIGEIEQIKDKFDWEQNLRTYLRRIRRKTAILIATCCKVGAMIAGLPPKSSQALYKYGYYLGMSFQITDDILDFTATEKQLGKPVGNDLIQGNITLPVLEAMKDQGFSDFLLQKAESRDGIGKEDIQELIAVMKRLEAIESSYSISDRYLEKAMQALSGLPDRKAKQTLGEIASFMGRRRS